MNNEVIELFQIFRKSSDTRHRNIGGEGIVVRQRASEVLVVTDVGARILDLIDGRTAVSGVVEAMLAEYEIDSSVLQSDTVDYLRELLAAGVIERAAI